MQMIELGSSDYKKFIEENKYYVDKTLFIEELLTKVGEVVLITRPRRFGKTLNLSMLAYYFNIEESNEHLFINKNISKSSIFKKYLNKYPVIFLTLKEVKGNSFEDIYDSFKTAISDLYSKYKYLKAKLDDLDNELFDKFISKNVGIGDYKNSLHKLSQFLYSHYNKKVIILLDEYDSMVNSLAEKDLYKQVIDLLRGLIGSTFKGNDYLEKGVITGILRIAKESLFSGANNITVRTMLDDDFADKFGFTEQEVVESLEYFKLSDEINEVKDWYNGYIFGSDVTVTIYNPYSIANYLNERKLKNYWLNTSNNHLIEELILGSDIELKKKIEELIKGNETEIEISEDVVFSRLNESKYIWTLFLFTGYLKLISKEYYNTRYKCKVKIVNNEVKALFLDIAEYYFSKLLNIPNFIKSLVAGDMEEFEKQFQELVINNISYHDPGKEPESVYHSFTSGALSVLEVNGYITKSQGEAGLGRFDIALIPKNKEGIGYIIEIKSSKNLKDLKNDSIKALEQIQDKQYYRILKEQDIKNIILIGIAFKSKKVNIEYNKNILSILENSCDKI